MLGDSGVLPVRRETLTKRRTSWLCRATWATALLPLALLAPSAASAAPPAGGVTALGCIQNSGGGACPATSPALDGAEGVAVSPDGANVYVASEVSDAIAIFARNAGGSLTYSGCIENTGAPVTCAASANALDGPRAVAVSPDGANVYVSAFDNATLSETFVTLDRASGGALSDGMSCFRGSNGYAGCPSGSLGDPRGIGISADGGSLYVAVSTSPGGITRFTRGFGGDVTFNGTSGLGILNAPFRVVVSPDGGNIYTAGTVSDDIVWIPRNADGSLILASAAPHQAAGRGRLRGYRGRSRWRAGRCG